MNDQQKAAQSSKEPEVSIPSEIKDTSLVPSTSRDTQPEAKGEPRSHTPVKAGKADRGPDGESASSFASNVHGYINEYIRFADQKAGFMFTAVAATLAFLHGKGVTKLWMKNPTTWGFPELLAFIAVIGLIVGAVASVLVLLPRGKGCPSGIVYWEAIARFSRAKDYADHVLATESAELTNAKLRHCHEIAQVCVRKYRAVSWAVWGGGIGLLSSVCYLALF